MMMIQTMTWTLRGAAQWYCCCVGHLAPPWGEGEDEVVLIRSACTHATNPTQKQFWFCNPTTVEGSKCFAKKVAKAHAAKAHEDDWDKGRGEIQRHDNDDNDNDGDKGCAATT